MAVGWLTVCRDGFQQNWLVHARSKPKEGDLVLAFIIGTGFSLSSISNESACLVFSDTTCVSPPDSRTGYEKAFGGTSVLKKWKTIAQANFQVSLSSTIVYRKH
jgi:hypothetical protein